MQHMLSVGVFATATCPLIDAHGGTWWLVLMTFTYLIDHTSNCRINELCGVAGVHGSTLTDDEAGGVDEVDFLCLLHSTELGPGGLCDRGACDLQLVEPHTAWD